MPRKPKDENDQLAKAIGERLTAALERQGISVTDLHKRTGISRTVLLAYTRGNYAPGARELKLICEHLEVTPTVLLFGSNEIGSTPYRLGDLAISSDGAKTLALITLIGNLVPSEQKAVMTLVESILIARNPEEHRKIVVALNALLISESGQEMMDQVVKGISQTVEPHASQMIAEMEEALKNDPP